MYIRSIRLENFKSHRDSTLVFDEFLTSLVGFSQAGKSHYFRALRVILLNGDFPNNWIRKGTSEAHITITLANGFRLIRHRKKSSQCLEVIDPDGNSVTYPNVSEMNGLVQEVTGIRRVVIDDASSAEELNFISQHEGLFMITQRPETVQRRISSMLGLEPVEKAIVKLNSANKSESSSKSGLEKKLTVIDSEIKDIEPVYQNTDELYGKLQECVKVISEKTSYYTNLLEISETLKKLEVANYQLNVLAKCKDKLSETTSFFESLQDRNNLILALRKKLVEVEKTEVMDYCKKVVLALSALLDEIKTERNKYSIILNSRKRLEDIIKLEHELTANTSRLEYLKKEIKVCPTCQKPL